MSVSFHHVLPRGWRDLLVPKGPVGIGLDPGTTTKKTSNPTGLALIQEVGADYIARVVVRFKTSDPDVVIALVRELCSLPHSLRVRRICADATSEKFFVANLRKAMAGIVPVDGIVGSENTEYRGEKMLLKAFTGNQLVHTMEDGHLLLPNEKWLEKDLRSVKRANGTFEADVDAEGNHADCFDAIKLGLHALMRGGGRVEASAAGVGQFGSATPGQKWWRNPFAGGGDSRRNLS